MNDSVAAESSPPLCHHCNSLFWSKKMLFLTICFYLWLNCRPQGESWDSGTVQNTLTNIWTHLHTDFIFQILMSVLQILLNSHQIQRCNKTLEGRAERGVTFNEHNRSHRGTLHYVVCCVCVPIRLLKHMNGSCSVTKLYGPKSWGVFSFCCCNSLCLFWRWLRQK